MKRNMRWVTAAIAAISLVMMTCTGCNAEGAAASGAEKTENTEKTAGQTEAGGEKIRAVLLVKKLNSSFWTDIEDAVKDQCAEYGWDVETLCPVTADSNEEQIELLEQSLLNPPDVYLLCPADSKGIAPVIEQINEAGVPIINVQTRISGDDLDYVTFIGVDTYEMAKVGATEILKRVPDAENVIILEGITGSNTTEDIKRGVTEVFEAAPGVTIVASQTANGQRQDGMTVTQNLLQANPDVDIIFAGNGEMALGAAEALRQSGKTGVAIATINTSAEITQAIMDGIITLTVDDVSWKLGQQGVVAAKDYFEGKELPKEILVDVMIEDKDNLDYYKEKYGLN